MFTDSFANSVLLQPGVPHSWLADSRVPHEAHLPLSMIAVKESTPKTQVSPLRGGLSSVHFLNLQDQRPLKDVCTSTSMLYFIQLTSLKFRQFSRSLFCEFCCYDLGL